MSGRQPHEDRLTVIEAIARHARETPEVIACKFLREGAVAEIWTYRELQRRLDAVANRLQTVAAPGERALLLYLQGLEFLAAFLGCLKAGIIAVPAYPPRKNRKLERLQKIVENCSPALLLTTSDIRSNLPLELTNASAMTVLTTEHLAAEPSDVSPRMSSDFPSLREITPQTVAYLQYTSGSSSDPKGTIITHGAVVANILQIASCTMLRNDLICVSWLPMYHDMGLVGCILQPLYFGGRTVLMTPTAFLQKPVLWLKALSDERGNCAASLSFGFQLCTKAISDLQKTDLDLTCVRYIANGSEPIKADVMDRVVSRFESCGFTAEKMFPCYGMAETTLLVTGGPQGNAPRRIQIDAETSAPVSRSTGSSENEVARNRWAVSCGSAAASTRIVVVDSQTRRPQPDGRIGEIWVQTPSMGSGYWGQVDLTRETFENFLAEDIRGLTSPGSPEQCDSSGPFLNTGDLGFLLDGELYVTGRSKDLIIIRGRNIYPQDVERAVEIALPFLDTNSCAAFALTDSSANEKLAVVIEANRDLVRTARAAENDNVARRDLDALVAAVREAIGEAMEVSPDAIGFMRPTTFPRTSSGKIAAREMSRTISGWRREFRSHLEFRLAAAYLRRAG